MEQNTAEWLRWRHLGIGSSDANIVMEVSKYKKRSQLLLEKQTPFDELPPQKDSGPIAALGHTVEEMERPRFELLMDDKFPATLKQSDDISYLRASYDGINESETIAWEHKLMGEEMFQGVVDGVCPEAYKPQIQQQFFVSPTLKEIHLCCVKYDKEMLKGKLNPSEFVRAKLVIERDEVYLQKELLPKLKKFWDEVLEKKDWTQLISVTRKRMRIKNLISKLEKKSDEFDPYIKESLKEIGGSLAVPLFSYSYTKQSRTSYDTKKMIEDGIDLSKYEKTSEFFTLKITERKKKNEQSK